MKKIFKVSGLLSALCFVACAEFPTEDFHPKQDNVTRSEAGDNYYWSGGRKIYLDTDYTKMIVSADNEAQIGSFAAIAVKENPFVGRSMALIDVSDEAAGQKVLADKSVKNKIFAQKYSGYDDAPFYMTGDIVMQPKEGVSVEDILAKNGVDAENVTKTDVGVVVRLKDWGKLLSTANTIYESKMVDWCHPDFISMDEMATNDQYFSRQYYLKNTGQTGGTAGIDINAEPAWAISIGAGIRVAVIDDGIEDHDDLAGRVLNGFTPRNPNGNNSNGGNGRPYPAIFHPSTGKRIGHGQACAGIIAASHNTAYTAGVAPNVDIVPINVSYGGESVYDVASAMEYAWNPNKGNADVISNSWGYDGPPNNADVLTQQINNAVNQGRLRNGMRKGCVVVFSSGNDYNSSSVNYPGYLSDVISVGAVDKYGVPWDYSNKGNGLDVVAPSGGSLGDVYTLDRMGSYGYSTDNYTSSFNGTSAAAPQVSGIAALILSVYPDLRGSDVGNIIMKSASYYPHRSNATGYGLVNAYKAFTEYMTPKGPNPVMAYAMQPAIYRAPAPSGGVVFNGWEVTPSYYTCSTYLYGDHTLSITFTSPGTFAVTAKYILPGGIPLNLTMRNISVVSATAQAPQIITPEGTDWYPYSGEMTFDVFPRLSGGVRYEWDCNEMYWLFNPDPTVGAPRIVNPTSGSYYDGHRLTARVRAVVGYSPNFTYSPWSNWATITLHN